MASLIDFPSASFSMMVTLSSSFYWEEKVVVSGVIHFCFHFNFHRGEAGEGGGPGDVLVTVVVGGFAALVSH